MTTFVLDTCVLQPQLCHEAAGVPDEAAGHRDRDCPGLGRVGGLPHSVDFGRDKKALHVPQCHHLSSLCVACSGRTEWEPLRRRGEDLHVHFQHGTFPIVGAYQMVTVCVSFISLLIGRR